jgi:hypothetical protein
MAHTSSSSLLLLGSLNSVWGLKLIVYEALSYQGLRPEEDTELSLTSGRGFSKEVCSLYVYSTPS